MGSDVAEVQGSVGTWFVDKKSRKRKYCALNGRVYMGGEGMRMARADEYSPSHPSQLVRSQLLFHIQSCDIASLFVTNLTANGMETDLIDLGAWGLPEQLVRDYARHKVTQLFQWQIDCLLTDSGNVLAGRRSVIYSAPTSGGKTLVAEILMLHAMGRTMQLGDPRQLRRKTILFVVPFIALAEEKAGYLRSVWRSMSVAIKTFHGHEGNTQALTPDVEVAICTIERANILMNELLAEGREEQLGMVVVDEAHMLGDRHRGYLLEVLLTKIRCISCTNSISSGAGGGDRTRVQIVAMSATLPNLEEVAKWLDAGLYRTDSRPVGLKHLVCDKGELFEVQVLRGINASAPGLGVPVPAPVSVPGPPMGGDVFLYDPDASCSTVDSLPSFEGMDFYQELDPAALAQPNPLGLLSHVLLPTAVSAGSSARHPFTAFYHLTDTAGDTATRFPSLAVGTLPISRPGNGSECQAPGQVTRKGAEGGAVDEARGRVVAVPSLGCAVHLQRAASLAPLPANITSQLPAPAAAQDPDSLVALCVHYLSRRCNVMVFCSSKKRCELSARAIAQTLSLLWRAGAASEAGRPVGDASFVLSNLDPTMRRKRSELVEALATVSISGLSPLLQELVLEGLCYHHAGLGQEERSLIEAAYRRGTLHILCTTSTLAAGVNLPAQAVILRSLTMGSNPLTVAAYRQMCGRAGRLNATAHSSPGEAVVLLSGGAGRDLKAFARLHCAEVDPLTSALRPATSTATAASSSSTVGAGDVFRGSKGWGATTEARGIERLLLDMVCGGKLRSDEDVMPTLQRSFLACTASPSELLALARDAVIYLKRHQFVSPTASQLLLASPLGHATVQSGLGPSDALQLLPLLVEARKGLVLSTPLHLLYLVVPSSAMTFIDVDWERYEALVDKLVSAKEVVPVVAALGINRAQLCAFRFHRPTGATEQKYKRFFMAMVLYSLLQECVVQLHLELSVGQLQQLQRDAGVQAHMVAVFARRLNYPALATCLEEIATRLSAGVQPHLLPLVQIGAEVTPARAKLLHDQGLRGAKDLVAVGAVTIAQVLQRALPYHFRDALRQLQRHDVAPAAGSGPGDADREAQACHRMATTIVAKAEVFLREEMRRRALQL